MFDKELELIKNDRLRENAEVLVDSLPDYFYEISASSTNKYHPNYTIGEYGLLKHVKVAVRIAYELLNNESLGNYTQDEKDLMLIALILHDGLKHGKTHEQYSRFDHPIIMADFIEEKKEELSFTDEERNLIRNCIASHMGQWNTNTYSNVILPKPVTKYERFVHMCDYLASRKFLEVEFDEDNNIKEQVISS